MKITIDNSPHNEIIARDESGKVLIRKSTYCNPAALDQVICEAQMIGEIDWKGSQVAQPDTKRHPHPNAAPPSAEPDDFEQYAALVQAGLEAARVYITIEGGIVQGVKTNSPYELDVRIIDIDTGSSDEQCEDENKALTRESDHPSFRAIY